MSDVRFNGVKLLLIIAAIACFVPSTIGTNLHRPVNEVAPQHVEERRNGASTNDSLELNGTSPIGDASSNVTADCVVSHESGRRYPVAQINFAYVSTPLIVSSWILFVSIAKIAFHSVKRLPTLFPESCLLIIIGALLGTIVYFAGSGFPKQLNTDSFFLILLPPIIIEAGYFMPVRAFFDQLGTILLFAVFGTLINTLMIGFSLWGIGTTGLFGDDVCLPMLHALVFASLLAAVDPVAVLAIFEQVHVNEVLYIVVFGESLLNDGISVVLYHMFEELSAIGQENIEIVDVVAGIGSFFIIVIGAPTIGVVLGLLGGFVSRFTNRVRFLEPLVVIVICYMSYIVCELFHLSGILGCTFCGITMRKYVESNISEKSQTTIKYAMKMLASATEAIIFMYLGIAAVSDDRTWNTSFILLTVCFCLMYRVIGVVVLTFLANRVRLAPLTAIDQFVMSFGGLRGAIAFSLSILLDSEEFPSKQLFVTTTIVMIYFTNIVMGTAVGPLIRCLKVKQKEKTEETLNEKVATRMIDHLMIAVESIADQHGHNIIRERFSAFNNRYLKPLIVGRTPRRNQDVRGRGSEIYRAYRRLSAKDARRLSLQPFSGGSLQRWRDSVDGNLDCYGSNESVPADSLSGSIAQCRAYQTTLQYANERRDSAGSLRDVCRGQWLDASNATSQTEGITNYAYNSQSFVSNYSTIPDDVVGDQQQPSSANAPTPVPGYSRNKRVSFDLESTYSGDLLSERQYNQSSSRRLSDTDFVVAIMEFNARRAAAAAAQTSAAANSGVYSTSADECRLRCSLRSQDSQDSCSVDLSTYAADTAQCPQDCTKF